VALPKTKDKLAERIDITGRCQSSRENPVDFDFPKCEGQSLRLAPDRVNATGQADSWIEGFAPPGTWRALPARVYAESEMDILLTFTGFHDPYSRGLVGEEDQPGPILSLVSQRAFDRIILLSTPNTEKNTAGTVAALGSRVPIEVVPLPLFDPTDYAAILKALRTEMRRICDEYHGARYYVAVASGTPQMHACWVLLASSGEVPAKLLHIRPPRFVTKDQPMVSEVDLTGADFPVVRSRVGKIDLGEGPAVDVTTTLAALGLVADHPKMMAALEVAAALASSTAPILIQGATGTGKELLARFVHHLSGRPAEVFVPLNCASIPKELAESVLFGHKKGSFTGALADQAGKFELADGGTLFLDELGELPLAAQAKLLRVLQDGMVEPIGAKKARKVDVRVVAATNQNLAKAIRQKNFREDLYYRLNVGEIHLPPLRERRSDIPKIALHVLDRINTSLKKPRRLSQAALARLQGQPWPGNVRDLQNVIERSARLARKDVIDAEDLIISEPIAADDPLSALPQPMEGFSMEEFLSSARKQLMLRAMEVSSGNQSEAARLLGVTPQAVHKYLLKLKGNSNRG
jgi:DNA-binding NtrC family response regulator